MPSLRLSSFNPQLINKVPLDGLYGRMLPSPPAIDFGSSKGKQLFREAIQARTMEGFPRLISNFQTQSELTYCGLASLSMVLNALSIDPRRKWKGPWRWFDESMLDCCCEPLKKVKENGISFGKLVRLAHRAGAKVEAFPTNQSTIDDFRKYIIRCSTSEDYHMISSYDRGTFKQTGAGHFSPIGGYHVEKDMALILDVARFKYPPHWVPLTLLWEAMNSVVKATGQHRGFMIVSKHCKEPELLNTVFASESSEGSSSNVKRKKLSEEFPSRPTDALTNPSFSDSTSNGGTQHDSKLPLKPSSIRIQVIKKPAAVSNTKDIAKSENKPEESIGLQSLCQNYDSDD